MDSLVYTQLKKLLNQLAKQIDLLYIGKAHPKEEIATLLKVFYHLQQEIMNLWIDNFAIVEVNIDDDGLSKELALRDKAIVGLQEEIKKLRDNLNILSEQTAAAAAASQALAARPVTPALTEEQPEVIENEEEIDFADFTSDAMNPVDIADDDADVVSKEAEWDVPQEVQEEVSREVSREVPQEIPREVSREVSREVPQEIPREVSREISKVVTQEVPQKTTQDIARDIARNTSMETSKETPKDSPRDIKQPGVEPFVVKEPEARPQNIIADNLFSQLAPKSLDRCISLNDSYLFKRSLFDHDETLYRSVIKDLNEKTDMSQVNNYIEEYFPQWDCNSEAVQRLLGIIELRLSRII